MFETHTTRTYDEAFARARAERAAAFRALLTFRLPSFMLGRSPRHA
ncbi:hypothetical protein [Jannaschia sp. M317]|nr:hypothetical protein [Jannaschia sp. M317]UWQ17871.1 hypothetical protein K3551_00690 [Jannaschia sp. M317]